MYQWQMPLLQLWRCLQSLPSLRYPRRLHSSSAGTCGRTAARRPAAGLGCDSFGNNSQFGGVFCPILGDSSVCPWAGTRVWLRHFRSAVALQHGCRDAEFEQTGIIAQNSLVGIMPHMHVCQTRTPQSYARLELSSISLPFRTG